ncbi:geranylgeranylglyceryl phosphate synthase [Chloroherpeton thalassium ATCC 35110]|uniref:Phosphoglycerol geranylgeranyltransferase n=1 Tax=Chloroherpeton thalassium (strain ATCC 35110 / GB-78) TaxID=517418 RepID=B3QW78_CHLT3|nr:geranylgeranylglyceryl/heptaprenylglyceryl phosphate synthase [Chloroherpeton thalassium]ACF13191.1 geranylgeranylglyceryl phosphate synthase [Chloroherpeton thalassium ATCC 35110]
MSAKNQVFEKLLAAKARKGAGFLLLIDPDKYDASGLEQVVKNATAFGADGFLIGGSLLFSNRFDAYVQQIKSATDLPVILFPGHSVQISPSADAILFLSLLSGRNPEFLIGHHVTAAPSIKAFGLESMPTAYLLVESGRKTAVEFMSNTEPIPRHKPELAAVHALAAEYLGMKMIYLEAGSGADESVPEEMVELVCQTVSLPVIVGGGIRSAQAVRSKVDAGASFVVVGNAFETRNDANYLKTMIDAAHPNLPKAI